eukprot:PITA_23125
MASSSTSSALASASTSTADGNNCYQFDVFLNHRGPDVKNTFVSHLYNRLRDHRLRVFLDREEIRKGEELTNEIDGAIRAASVHLAIFSPNYCQSPWCLNELLLMLEMKQKKGSTVLPIFFHVKPSALRWAEGEKGVYAQSLSSLQKKRTSDSQPRHDSDIIGKWKQALHDVAGISGFDLDEAPYNSDEGKLLAHVVEEVLKVVPKIPLHVAKYPTGLVEKVADFEKKVLLQKHESAEARVVGIVGLGGVGKTTLAKEFFNSARTKYRRSSFLSDVREKHRGGSLDTLQRQLIKDLNQLDRQINNTDEGISLLKRHLSASNALMVVDDVDHIDQLEALISPAKDVLGSSSLILVTSRDKGVLTDWGVEDGFIYMLEGLNPQHSTELFCWHAFRKPHAVAGFEQLVNDFLDACKGLPLSLKVIGSLLYRKNLEYWKAQLRKISKILPEDIQKTLKISYDSLDEEEKQIFIDIACFLIGERKDRAIRIWDGSGWEGSLGLQNLQNKCLVELKAGGISSRELVRNDEVLCISMHDHLRDLGRSLPDTEHLRRIWRVTGNRSDPSPVQRIKNSEERDRLVTELQLPDGKGSYLESLFNVEQPPQPIMLRWYNYPYSASEFSTEKLRILHIKGRDLEIPWEHESEAPLELRELYISASRLSKIPDSIGQLKHLEKIVLGGDNIHSISYCRLKTLPDEFCQLLSLKHLELINCSSLSSLPDSFGNLTKLQHIELFCPDLLMLPNSFENLIELEFLSLLRCDQLIIYSETLGKITTLENFYLSGCTTELPPQLTSQRFLREMFLEVDFKELPSDFGNLCNLENLVLESSCLEMLPPSFGHLRSLEKLTFGGCPLKCFPDSVRMLTQLKSLNIHGNQKVEKLELKECPSREVTFQNVVEEVETVTDSRGRGVSSKMDASEASYFINAVFPNLQHLEIAYCHRLVEVGALPTTLQSLEIEGCEMLEELPNMQTLLSLEKLTTTGSSKLKRIHGLGQLTKLQYLDVHRCPELEELPGIEQSPSLETVWDFGCPKLQSEFPKCKEYL